MTLRVTRQELLARVGTVLADKYRLDRLLGSGAMGAVYAGVNTWTQQKVAIKLLLGTMSPRALARFFREARVGVRLDHAHIVRVFDIGRSADNTYFIVQELLHGESLQGRLDSSDQLDLRGCFEIIVPIMTALSAAHTAGVVHRDLKPENIFIAGRGGPEVPVLIDFGISKVIEGDGQNLTEDFIGTPAYVSPEQAMNEDDVGPAADVWAIGAVIYRCLSGRTPFQGTPAGVLVSVTTKSPEPLTDVADNIPTSVAEVVMRALERKAEARWPSMEAMIRALLACREVRATDWGLALAEQCLDDALLSSTMDAVTVETDEERTASMLAELGTDTSLLGVIDGGLEDTTREPLRPKQPRRPTSQGAEGAAAPVDLLDTDSAADTQPERQSAFKTILDDTTSHRRSQLRDQEQQRSELETLSMPVAEARASVAPQRPRETATWFRYVPFAVLGITAIATIVLFVAASNSELRKPPPSEETTAEEAVGAHAESLAPRCEAIAQTLMATREPGQGYSGLVHIPATGWATAQALAAIAEASHACAGISDGDIAGPIKELAKFQQPRGWGEFEDGQETPAAAWALLAFTRLESDGWEGAALQRALARDFVLLGQRKDGGFADKSDPTSDAYQTLMSVWALLEADALAPDDASSEAIDLGLAWLRTELDKAIYQSRGQLDVANGLVAHAIYVLYLGWKHGRRAPDDPALFAGAIDRIANDCQFSHGADPPMCQRPWEKNDGVRIHVPNDERTGVISMIWVPWTLLATSALAADDDIKISDEVRGRAAMISDGIVTSFVENEAALDNANGFVLAEWVFVLGRLTARGQH